MQITRKEIEDMLTTMETNDILFVEAGQPLKPDGLNPPIHYIPNEIQRFHIVNMLCSEYEITE